MLWLNLGRNFSSQELFSELKMEEMIYLWKKPIIQQKLLDILARRIS